MKKPCWFRPLVITAAFILLLSSSTSLSHGAAGDVDLSFNAGLGVNGQVAAIAIQPDGKVIVGGSFAARIARLNDDGGADSTFNGGSNLAGSDVQAIALQPDGRVLAIVGNNLLARLNADGTDDTSFSADIAGDRDQSTIFVNTTMLTLGLQPDGKILVAGFTTYFVPEPDCPYYPNCPGDTYKSDFVIRLHANGSLDPSFNRAAPDDPVHALALQPDGKVVLLGSFKAINATNRNGVARLNANGSLDISFNPGFGVVRIIGDPQYDIREIDYATTVTAQPDGKLLFGVRTEYSQCDVFEGGCLLSTTYSVVRLNVDGSKDPGFVFTNVVNNAALLGQVSAIAVQPDGKIVISSSVYNTVRIGRLNAGGSWDDSFMRNTMPDGSVDAIALQPDGKVLIAGTFTTVNGTNRNRVARLYGADVGPALTIARSTGATIVSWPVTATGFVLDQSLTPTGGWSQVALPYATNANVISVTPAAPIGNRFYRLRKP